MVAAANTVRTEMPKNRLFAVSCPPSRVARPRHLSHPPLLSPASRCDPPDDLFCEPIKRGHTLLEVFLFGVLDLVVTDSMQALHEHHHRRHPRAAHFGCV